MLNVPNILSFLRLPLAFVFLQINPFYRAIAIFFAMASDFLDGFLARRFNQVNTLGAILDPIMDKFFVFFILSIFVNEHRLSVWEACVLMSRDFAVLAYGGYLALKSELADYKFRAIWSGKITTVLQFIVLIALTFDYYIPKAFYFIFLLLGFLAFIELCITDWLRARAVKQGDQ